MPSIELTEEQVLRCLDQLSPAARRAALMKLVTGIERLDLLIEQNRQKLEAVCRTRGVEFARLTEEQRETLIDDILHERV